LVPAAATANAPAIRFIALRRVKVSWLDSSCSFTFSFSSMLQTSWLA
jgi:hypothetical protein